MDSSAKKGGKFDHNEIESQEVDTTHDRTSDKSTVFDRDLEVEMNQCMEEFDDNVNVEDDCIKTQVGESSEHDVDDDHDNVNHIDNVNDDETDA